MTRQALISIAAAAAALAGAAGAGAHEPPRMLSAYFGCDGCIGVADENGDGSIVDEALAAGHNVVELSDGTLATSAAPPAAAALLCLGQANPRYVRNLDGMPVTFSSQVAGTPHAWAFEVELSDGTRRAPLCANLAPAAEENEDRTVLLVGEFGGPEPRGCEPARAPWPVAVRVVGDLFLEGEVAPVSATGVEYAGRFLDLRGGPEIVAAELAPFSTAGEVLIGLIPALPNHCGTVAPGTTHVLRVTFSGGVTTNGVVPFTPDRTDLFALRVRNDGGDLVGGDDPSLGGAVSFLALGDLGAGPATGAPDLYVADGDNILDLCLALAPGFDPRRIEAVATSSDPAAGTAFFDPTGDTPAPPQVFPVDHGD